MNKRWKYFIVLNNDECDYVEDEQTRDGLPVGSDFSFAKGFDTPEELLGWVEEHTTLSVEDEDFHIEGHYVIINFE